MAQLKKTWRERLHEDKGLPKIETVEPGMSQKWGSGKFIIPAPIEVDELIRHIRKGRLVTINDLRDTLATKYEVNFACPITTGIAVTISARAAAEDEAEGKKRITPYWRVLRSGGYLNPKYPGGELDQKARLEAEGHTVLPHGKRYIVDKHEKKVQALA